MRWEITKKENGIGYEKMKIFYEPCVLSKGARTLGIPLRGGAMSWVFVILAGLSSSVSGDNGASLAFESIDIVDAESMTQVGCCEVP